MSSTIKATGSCLCGAVTIKAEAISTELGACHCNMCRKWSGSPFLTVESKGNIDISGEEHINRFNSSEWAERGFCNQCGTHLFYRLIANNQYMMPAGLFDTEINLNFNHQIFIEEKPEYYAFSNETKNMTGAEVFAQFSNEENT